MPRRLRLCLLVAALCCAGVGVARATPVDTWSSTATERRACLRWFDSSGPGWRSVELCGVSVGDEIRGSRSVRAVRTMRTCDGSSCALTTTTYEGEAAPGELIVDPAAASAVFDLTLTGDDPSDRCAVRVVAHRNTWDEPQVGGHQPLIVHGPSPTRPGDDQTSRWVHLNHPDHQHRTTVEVDADSGEVRAQHQGWSRTNESGEAAGHGSVCGWVTDAPTTSAWLSSSDVGAVRVSAVVGPQPG